MEMSVRRPVISRARDTMALSGTRASELIQGTYSLTLPSFIVLLAALYQEDTKPLAGVLTLGAGIAIWIYEVSGNIAARGADADVLSPGFPAILLGTCFVIYFVTDRLVRWHDTRDRRQGE